MTQKWGQTPHFSTFLSSWFLFSISSDIFAFFSVSSFVSSRIFCFSCSFATTSFCRSLLIPKRRGKREWAVKLCHSKLKVWKSLIRGGKRDRPSVLKVKTTAKNKPLEHHIGCSPLVCFCHRDIWLCEITLLNLSAYERLTHDTGRADSFVGRSRFPGWGTPRRCSSPLLTHSSPFPPASLGSAETGNMFYYQIWNSAASIRLFDKDHMQQSIFMAASAVQPLMDSNIYMNPQIYRIHTRTSLIDWYICIAF